MKHSLKFFIALFSNVLTVLVQADDCCKRNSCVDFKQKAQYVCLLNATDSQISGSGYINNATITNNLHTINNNINSGTFTAENVTIEGQVDVNGTITVDGEIIIATDPVTEITQYGYFVLTTLQDVANNGFVQFNTTVTANGISNAAGVITFTEPGFYIANFTLSFQNPQINTFQLVYDPAGTPTAIADTAFRAFGPTGSFAMNGIAIINIPTAGTTIGLQNISGTSRLLNQIGIVPGVFAAIQIAKISN